MQKVKEIVFLGSKPVGAACLDYLLQMQTALNVKVVAIGTKDRLEFGNENPIRTLAAKYDIPVIAHPDDIPTCDIIYSVQYDKILRLQHIEKARQITVNLHLAPLPDFRGCNQFSFAIYYGAKEFGVTIHEIDQGVDSGPILFEHRFEMARDIWVKELYDLSVANGIALFQDTLKDLVAGNYVKKEQSSLIATRGLNVIKRKDMEIIKNINLNESAAKTMNRIRASYMPGFPPPYVMIDGKKVAFIVSE